MFYFRTAYLISVHLSAFGVFWFRWLFLFVGLYIPYWTHKTGNVNRLWAFNSSGKLCEDIDSVTYAIPKRISGNTKLIRRLWRWSFDWQIVKVKVKVDQIQTKQMNDNDMRSPAEQTQIHHLNRRHTDIKMKISQINQTISESIAVITWLQLVTNMIFRFAWPLCCVSFSWPTPFSQRVALVGYDLILIYWNGSLIALTWTKLKKKNHIVWVVNIQPQLIGFECSFLVYRCEWRLNNIGFLSLFQFHFGDFAIRNRTFLRSVVEKTKTEKSPIELRTLANKRNWNWKLEERCRRTGKWKV